MPLKIKIAPALHIQIFIILFLMIGSPNAQQFNYGVLNGKRPNIISFYTGFDLGMTARIGYSRVFHIWERPFILTAEYMMPLTKFDFNDFKLTLGGQTPILNKKPWKIIGRINPLLIRGIETKISKINNFGIDFAFVGGYHSTKWFCAIELGLDWAIASHIVHSDYYKKVVYPDAVDGWYSSTGGNFIFGLHGGYSWKVADLILKLGHGRNFKFDMYPFAFSVTLGVNVRF